MVNGFKESEGWSDLVNGVRLLLSHRVSSFPLVIFVEPGFEKYIAYFTFSDVSELICVGDVDLGLACSHLAKSQKKLTVSYCGHPKTLASKYMHKDVVYLGVYSGLVNKLPGGFQFNGRGVPVGNLPVANFKHEVPVKHFLGFDGVVIPSDFIGYLEKVQSCPYFIIGMLPTDSRDEFFSCWMSKYKGIKTVGEYSVPFQDLLRPAFWAFNVLMGFDLGHGGVIDDFYFKIHDGSCLKEFKVDSRYPNLSDSELFRKVIFRNSCDVGYWDDYILFGDNVIHNILHFLINFLDFHFECNYRVEHPGEVLLHLLYAFAVGSPWYLAYYKLHILCKSERGVINNYKKSLSHSSDLWPLMSSVQLIERKVSNNPAKIVDDCFRGVHAKKHYDWFLIPHMSENANMENKFVTVKSDVSTGFFSYEHV